MTSILGIVLALALLMVLAYRGISVLILAPLMALLAALFSGAPLLASYTQVFMPALGSFIIAFFPLFLLGAVFGKLMEASGAAQTIANGIVAALGSQRAIAAGGLDALPHNGAVITLLGICELTHRQSCLDIFVVGVALPLLALVVAVLLGSAFGSF